MSDDEQRAEQKPWRKRHPVLSRAILYVLGAGLVALLAILYVRRQDVDRADELKALRKELDALGAVMSADATGATVLKVLADEKFAAADLPPSLQAHVLRWRAMALRRQQDHARAAAALEQAARLPVSRHEHAALRLEWAEARLERGDAEGALDMLPNTGDTAGRPMGLLYARLWAQARANLGDVAEARGALRGALEPLTQPLPDQPTDFVGGRPWTRAQAATVLTEYLVQLDAAGATAAWLRLIRLAPDDFAAQVAAARGLAGLKRRADALRAWRRATALDPRQADAEAERDPRLAALREGGR